MSTQTLDPTTEARFEQLTRDHRAAFERLARRLARDGDDAQDLLQETLVDAYRAFGSFRPDSHFYSWVARIMTNNHLDRRRRKQHPTVSLEHTAAGEDCETLDLPDHGANPERLLLREHLDSEFQQALQALQPHHRATVLLCDLDGATYEEAAAAEFCPVGTIRSRLHRAHKALKEFLGHVEERTSPVLERALEPESRRSSRRNFLWGTMAAAGAAFTSLDSMEEALAAGTVRVLVWADTPGAASALAEALASEPGLVVRTASAADPHLGLSDAALRDTDVLIWSAQPRRLPAERTAAIVRRVRDEGMGFIAAQGGHQCAPLLSLLGVERMWEGERSAPEAPLALRVTAPRHPIARGVAAFELPHADHFPGTLAAPTPDVVVFDGAAPGAARPAWQGMVWTVGKGRIFYFQPGQESTPFIQQEEVKRILQNAARWAGLGVGR